MNIEEAKKKLLEPQKIPLIEIIRKFKREGIENFVITRPEIVETLLTAYEKEKEKNKELTERVLRLESDKFWDNVVSKDKIKAKIEELENEKEKYFEKQVIQHEIEILQSLLDKE